MVQESAASRFEHRRQRLIELRGAVEHRFRYWFANAVGVADDYLSRLELPATDKNSKNLGDETIAKIQAKFRLAPGWFDRPMGTDLPTGCRILGKSGEVHFDFSGATVQPITEASRQKQEILEKINRLEDSERGVILTVINAFLGEKGGPATGKKPVGETHAAAGHSPPRRRRKA